MAQFDEEDESEFVGMPRVDSEAWAMKMTYEEAEKLMAEPLTKVNAPIPLGR